MSHPIHRVSIAPLLILLAFGVAGCHPSDAHLEPRFVAVHNSMTAMGMAQSGAISQGALGEGEEIRIDVHLTAGKCYTFLALGGERVRNVDVRVVGAGDEELGRDATHDRQAAAQVCPGRSDDYQVVVRMVSGRGDYLLTSWSGLPSSANASVMVATPGGGGGGPGSCQAPIDVTFGESMRGNTQQGGSLTQGTCASGDAPEQVYRIVVEARSRVSARLSSSFDGALYLLRSCGEINTQMDCNDDSPDTTHSRLDTILDPGTYFLVVDGYGSGSGDYELVVDTAAMRPIAEVCADATALTLGQPVSGTTEGEVDYFQATCAGGSRSPDRVFRLEVPSRSRLRVRQQSDHDGSLHIRSDCEQPNSEIACNDDFGNVRESLVTAVVDEGVYYVYTDGYSGSGRANTGNYSLTAHAFPAVGGGAAGDTCQAPETLASGSTASVDTIEAMDDLRGSCGGEGAPDIVHSFDVRHRSRVRLNLSNSEFEGVAYVQRSCGDADSEVACASFGQGGNANSASFDQTLTPGTYFLVIDGARPDAFGAADIDLRVDDLRALTRTCQRAPQLRSGRSVSGSTQGESDDFQASCAEGARSGDTVYRLRLPRRSRVLLELHTPEFDGAIHIRRACDDASTEVACNDDEPDNRHSRIDSVLDAGRYFVVVDGYAAGNEGAFTLRTEISRP